MVSDTVYELSLPILHDTSLEEEDKTEKLEELLRKETTLSGAPLENAILDILWRFRDSAGSDHKSSPQVRHTVVRRPSPAPWQIPRAATPMASSPSTGTSPAIPPGFTVPPPAFRAKSSAASPFSSPRPSPRLAFSSPQIPHSPSLNAYEFTDSGSTPDIYGDYGSDTVDWLVNDDTASNVSGHSADGGLSATAASWIQPQQSDMSPFDMLRSVLGDGKSDEEIENALETNGYDLSATVMALMGDQSEAQQALGEHDSTVLVGKSMSPHQRPVTPSGSGRSGVVCKYWLSTGTCLRADCRFSHDLSNHICKYWIMGNCLAGDTCIFSHDPSSLVSRLTVEDETPPIQNTQASFQLQDYTSFPSLQPTQTDHWGGQYQSYSPMYSSSPLAPPPGLKAVPSYMGDGSLRGRPNSRPSSRHQSYETTPSVPSVDDTEAFPSLGSAVGKGGKKHHGKRGGHGHHQNKDTKENTPNSLADLVRMSPSPGPAQSRKNMKAAKSQTGSRESSAAAQAIPAPKRIPWLETGEKANKAYLKARQDAIKHGGLRNKFLQSAAQAWNRSDARAAKALSLRGQSENDLMRKAHREAARLLYEERNKDASGTSGELYVDLHGLHPEEAVEYLSRALQDHQASSRALYAITGTGHHSKSGKDKVGKAIRAFLNEYRYAYREFSVPGDRNNVGGILGIDPSSFDREVLAAAAAGSGNAGVGEAVGLGVGGAGQEQGHGHGASLLSTKIRLVREAELAGAGSGTGAGSGAGASASGTSSESGRS
ncbi:MAG: hypothetical protein M1819_002554 [Sarea resinae]|nr:MAG: hypothetical protein M1819_002554 [Sarea resinae]